MCIVSAFLFYECENENKGLKNMDQVEHQEKIRRQNIDRNIFVFLWTSPSLNYLYVDYVGGRTHYPLISKSDSQISTCLKYNKIAALQLGSSRQKINSICSRLSLLEMSGCR